MDYDKDDEEADAIYEMVQNKMAERRKQKRDKREEEEAADYLKNNPRIQDRFSDLKRELSSVSDMEWEK
jgi:pre-mRNA-processing factor 6